MKKSEGFDWEAYFKQFPGKNWLSKRSCLSCKKTISVAVTEPIPEEQMKLVDGMSANYNDYQGWNDQFLGWLCYECAWKLAGCSSNPTYKAKGGISGGGGMLPEFNAHTCDLSLEIVPEVSSS